MQVAGFPCANTMGPMSDMRLPNSSEKSVCVLLLSFFIIVVLPLGLPNTLEYGHLRSHLNTSLKSCWLAAKRSYGVYIPSGFHLFLQ